MFSLHDSDICCHILETLPTGICVVDMQKRILFWSDGAERITGHLRHEVVAGASCKPEAPLDPANRVFSVIVQYIVKNNDDDEKSPSTSSEKGAETKQSPPVEKPAAKP